MKQEIIDRRKEENKRSDTNQNNNTQPGKKDASDVAREAFDDIEEDADLSIHSPNDDLDEGETARLGEDKTDLI